MRRIWTIARRELKALFDHPTGYVLLVVYLGLTGFLYFRQAYLNDLATLRPMFDLMPWVFLFFVPAVTMRSLAEDSRSGLLEVVLAQPLTEFELLLGKYLGSVLFLWTALALTLPIPLALTLGAELHWGTIAAQYVGGALLAAGLAGVGVWASSLTRSQITAFIVGVAVMFVLVLVGLDPLVVGLPPTLGALAARLGVLSHFENIGRGVIDLRDAIYFVSLAGVFLALAYGALVTRKLAHGAGRRRLKLGVALLVSTLVAVNLLGSHIGGRLDLTPGNAYTLSKATREIVGGLDDLVTIKVFASQELPTEVALLKRDVDDLLRDIRSAGEGKVRVLERDPARDEAARGDARSLGIQPVQFNVIGESELQVKEGYLGLAIQHAGSTETIPFVHETNDLEYRVASAIRTLSRTKKPALGVLNEVRGGGLTYQALLDQLEKSYDLRYLSLADSTQPAKDLVGLVLIGSPDSLPADQLSRFEAFLGQGGSALVLAGGMRLDSRSPTATPRPVAWNALLEPYGVQVREDLVYDLVANEVIPLPTDVGRVLKRYPFFVRAQSTGGSIINRDLNDLVLTWTSSLDTTGAAPGTLTPLLLSSRGAGVATGETSIEPTRPFAEANLATRLYAVQVTPMQEGAARRGRVVVVADEDFAADRYVQTAPENLAFALNAADWIAQDEALIGIRSKERRPPPLVFASATEREAVKYADVIGIPALVALAGLVRLTRRRRKARDPYRPLHPAEVGAA